MEGSDIVFKKLKKIWSIAIILGSLIVIGSNLLAQKLFYQDQLKDVDNRLTIIEKKRRADDSLTTISYNKYLKVLTRIELNLKENICPKLGIKYTDIPKVFDDE